MTFLQVLITSKGIISNTCTNATHLVLLRRILSSPLLQMVSCGMCDSTHISYPAYIQHLKVTHKTTLTLQCKICSSEYESRSAMNIHYSANHPKHLDQMEYMNFQVATHQYTGQKEGFKRPNTKKCSPPAPAKRSKAAKAATPTPVKKASTPTPIEKASHPEGRHPDTSQEGLHPDADQEGHHPNTS